MRPPSIVMFERVVILYLLLGFVSIFLVWDETTAQMAQAGLGGTTVIVVQAIVVAIYLLLLYFISRKASSVARWIYVVLAVIGLVAGIFSLVGTAGEMDTLVLVLAIVQYALTAYSLYLLFRPDARAWFDDGRAPADPDTFA